jgi:hypothetical protein
MSSGKTAQFRLTGFPSRPVFQPVFHLHVDGRLGGMPPRYPLQPRSGSPPPQRALFQAAIQYFAGRDLVNTVVEVCIEGQTVRCLEWECPPGKSHSSG